MSASYHFVAVAVVGLAGCQGESAPKSQAPDADRGPVSTMPAPIDPNEVAPDPPDDRRAIAVATGGATTCAVLHDGSVWCWGSDASGELGWNMPLTMNWPSRHLPTRVAGVEGATSVAISQSKVCAVVQQGHVWCWGESKRKRVLATRVPGIEGATQLELGRDQIGCAALQSGKVACWKGVASKAVMLGGGPFVEIELTSGMSRDKTMPICLRDKDGAVHCSGLDRATTHTLERTHVQLSSRAVSLSGRFKENCAVQDNGQVMCWKPGEYKPVRKEGAWLDGHVVSTDGACALMKDGVLKCQVQERGKSRVVVREGVKAFAGGYGACALDDEGVIACQNGNGVRLGVHDELDRFTFRDVVWSLPKSP